MTVMQRKTFVTGDGVALSYGSIGKGQPLVMIHGWSQTADQFRYQFDAFAANANVITYDQRGQGLSTAPRSWLSHPPACYGSSGISRESECTRRHPLRALHGLFGYMGLS